MAKLKDEHLDALLSKGLISTELYDRAKSEDNKEKAIADTAKEASKDYKKAEEDLRLAENNASDDPFGIKAMASGSRPAAPPTASDAGSGLMTSSSGQVVPGVSTPPAPTQSGPAGYSAMPPRSSQMVVLPDQSELNKYALPPPPARPPGTYMTLQDVLPAKQNIPVSDVAGGKPAEAPAAAEEKKPLDLPKPTGGGVSNIYAGPSDFEKYLTPAEKDRKTQLVEESNLRQDITKRAGDIQMREDQQLAEIEQRKALEYKAIVDQQAKVRELEQQEVKKNLDTLMAESKKISETKLDPDRAWSRGLFGDNRTANKVLAGIGMFFGAAATKKGGANPVVQQIEQAIDRDIKMQEFDIKNASAGVEQRKGLLQERIKQFGNNELARIAAKKDYLDITENQIKAVVAGNASDKTRTKMDELLASLEETRTKTLNEFNMVNDQRSRQMAAQAAAAQAQANAKLYEEYKARRDFGFKVNEERIKAGLPPLTPEQLAGVKPYDYTPSGKEGAETLISLNSDPFTGKPLAQPQLFRAKTADDAKKLKEAQESYDVMMKNIQNLQDLRTKYGGGSVSREAVALGRLYRQNIVGAVKKMDELGALDKGVENYVDPLVPSDPMEYSPLGTTDEQLKAFKTGISENFQSKLKTRLSPASVALLPKSPAEAGGTKNTK